MILRLALGGPLTTLLMQHSLVPTAAAQWARPGAPQRGLALARSARPPRRSLAASATSGSKFGALPNEPELPFAVYTPEENAAYWQTRPVAVVTRTLQISAALGSWLMEGRLTNRSAGQQQLTDVRADKLRHLLTELGPAFVKIGQAVSSRPDVAPPEYLRELEKLQDQIPPFCNDQAFAVIQAEYGVPASQVFSSISPEAVAAASLGQVYRGVLRSTGEAVAVKVQRPGVAASIALDVFVLRQLLAFVRRWRRFNTDLPGLLDEWAASLFRELDYRHEAANGVRFRELYGHMEDVYVPRMHTELCTRKVLVMEWVDGERLRTAYSAARDATVATIDVPGAPLSGGASSSNDDLRLVEVGVRCSLEQMLEEGFYHADPHPGNLLRTRDGKLAYLDFGMMGQVDATIRRGLMRATLHLVNREFEALADDFVTLGMLPKAEGNEKEAIVPALTGVFAEALRGGVSNLSFGELSGNLGRTMYQFHFRIPPYYTLLVRSLSVLEGIALASDPNYKVLGAAYPWIARRLLTDTTPELRSTLMALLYKDGAFNFRRMESLISQAVRPTGRPQPRRGAAPGQSAVQRGDALALLLSPEGEFVRGVVTEELAKGIDAAARLAADTAVGELRQQLLSASLQARGGNAAGAASGSSLLVHALAEALAVLPQLSDARDQEQVEGITRLAQVLQESTAGQRQQQGGDWFNEAAAANGAVAGTPFETAFKSLQTAADILSWIAAEAETLSPDERAEALRLPLSIGQAVASRAAARTIRWLLVGEALFNSPAAASPAEAAAAAERAARAARKPASSTTGFAAAAAASAYAPQPRRPGDRTGGGSDGGDGSGTSSPSSSKAASSSSSSSGSTAARKPEAAMRPLSPTSSRPPSSGGRSSSSSPLAGPSYRASAAGSSVIVRPAVTAAATSSQAANKQAAVGSNGA
ncbi:putative aarF domain-containing kinase chloroplastic [Chlorella sorokiniana]|uniref:AarF domain-containing kinase chloroplastic n=1 Tax=Chlorella sorokiniana TaxID=3076 RepID=A0A2P6TTY2_CHLSO|nr:putative aarF domain-containing kinase chloroplastic [Chlorella sorokiniana]|eukprot:PRW57519.1 putative aarF domain-containing kinase chloroplastic [Chlorella sorokiniana]